MARAVVGRAELAVEGREEKRLAVRIGTKSVLFGAHCARIHPAVVFIAYWKLYGFPFDRRL